MLKRLRGSSKIDILFLHPPLDYNVVKIAQSPEIPMGLACLASYLESKGISSAILDMYSYPKPYTLLREVLAKRRPAIVGITSYSPTINESYEVSKAVKDFDPKITTIIGGLHASALPQEALESCPSIDYLVYGEGELTLYELADNIIHNQDTQNLKGTAIRHDGKIKLNPPRELIPDLDSLPFPAREKLELGRYHSNPNNHLQLPTTTMFTTRGCPFHCTFCSTHHIWGSSVRLISARRIFAEVQHCRENYNIRDFDFNDDTFTLSKSRVIELCNLFIENKLGVSWCCFSRVDTVDYELLCLMKEAGCFYIRYGIESGTESSLRLINKGTTLKQARDAIYWTKKAGIESQGSFILGVPGETIRDAKETIAFAKVLNPDIAVFRTCFPVPGSKMYDALKTESKTLPLSNWERLKDLKKYEPKLIFEILRISLFYKLGLRAYFSFYLSPGWIIQKIKRFLKNPKREISKFCFGFPAFLKRVRK